MKSNPFLVSICLVLFGCECDSICESHNQTTDLLSSYSEDIEVVRFLNQYNGEAPGVEKFSVFVNWGASNPKKVVAIISHEQLATDSFDQIVYTISEMGHNSKYCQIYKNLEYSAHVIEMQKRIQGCV